MKASDWSGQIRIVGEELSPTVDAALEDEHLGLSWKGVTTGESILEAAHASVTATDRSTHYAAERGPRPRDEPQKNATRS